MQNVATISKMTIGKQAEAACKDFYLREPFTHFRRLIQTADWDNSYLLNEGIDNICRYLLVAVFICSLAPIAWTLIG